MPDLLPLIAQLRKLRTEPALRAGFDGIRLAPLFVGSEEPGRGNPGAVFRYGGSLQEKTDGIVVRAVSLGLDAHRGRNGKTLLLVEEPTVKKPTENPRGLLHQLICKVGLRPPFAFRYDLVKRQKHHSAPDPGVGAPYRRQHV